MKRLEEGILPGHFLILLWRISFSTFTNESVFPKYFEYTYGVNAEQALQESAGKALRNRIISLCVTHTLKCCSFEIFVKR